MPVKLTTRTIMDGPDAAGTAARCLAGGGLVAFPTETVYGLGADATNADAIAQLYLAKGRPSFNPLIAHVGTLAAAQKIARFSENSLKLAQTFWPGPLTLVLPRTDGCPVSHLATAGLDTVAVRIPAHQVARNILETFAKPVVAPSANLSGHVSPTTARHVHDDLFGRIDLIVDGGPVNVGVESTIIACVGTPVLLRPGGLPRAEIERVLGAPLPYQSDEMQTNDAHPLAPGMLASHYAPRTPVHLRADSLEPGEVLLAFGPLPFGIDPARALNLSARGDLMEAAANLFSHLRLLDARNASAIAVMPIPNDGIGEAINDRLRRAAVQRD